MWYVIQVRAGHEQSVAERCRRDVLEPGEDIFVMMSERFFKKKGVWTLTKRPTFQKYLFAETSNVDDFRIRLRRVKELTKMLGAEGEILPIYPDEEKLLRRLGGTDHVIDISKAVRVDKKLEITSGSMEGMEGEIKWVDRHQRMAGVEVSLMGREMTIKLGIEIEDDVPNQRRLMDSPRVDRN